MLGNAFIIAFAIFTVRFVALEAAFQQAKHTGSFIRFPVGAGLRILFRLGGPFLILVGYKMSQQASNRFDTIAAVAVAIMGIACLLGEPGEIIATPNGLIQRSVLGMRRRTISWNGSAASYLRGLRQVLVISGDGTTIIHSQYHVGQSEFLHELNQHQVYIQS